jgi:hypothetical protein
LCAGLAAAARIDHREKHRSPTRSTPQPRAFRGTDAKEFPILILERDEHEIALALGPEAAHSYPSFGTRVCLRAPVSDVRFAHAIRHVPTARAPRVAAEESF